MVRRGELSAGGGLRTQGPFNYRTVWREGRKELAEVKLRAAEGRIAPTGRWTPYRPLPTVALRFTVGYFRLLPPGAPRAIFLRDCGQLAGALYQRRLTAYYLVHGKTDSGRPSPDSGRNRGCFVGWLRGGCCSCRIETGGRKPRAN